MTAASDPQARIQALEQVCLGCGHATAIRFGTRL